MGRTGDTKGKCISTEKTRLDVRSKPRLAAGYVGLNDTSALKRLFLSKAWTDIVDPYEADKTANNRTIGSVQGVFALIKHRKELEKYGEKDADKSRWTANDHAAHVTCQILKASLNLPENPEFGPFEGERELESWNRAYGLVEVYHWLTTKDNGNRKFFNDYNHGPASKPHFMSKKSSATAPPLPEKPKYLPFKFQARWIDKNKILAQVPHLEAQIVALPTLFRVPDPRLTDQRQFRDHVRRTLNFGSLGLDITTMILKTPVETWNTRTEWAEIGATCIAAVQPSDFDGFEFILYSEVVPAGRDIFESEIIEGLDEIYDVAGDQTLVRRVASTCTEPTGEEDEEDEEDQEGVLPVDFFPPEEPDADGFDPFDSRDDKKRRDFQRNLLRNFYAGSIATNTHQDVSEGETAVHEQAARLTDLAALDATVAKESDEERLALARTQGGETFLGPDFLHGCKLNGLSITDPKPSGCRVPLRPHQVTMMYWCQLQVIGLCSRPKGSKEVIWKQLPICRGIISDQMGVGKTHGMLAFINWYASQTVQQKSSLKPSLWLTGASLLYQTADIIIRDFPAIRLLIYAGTTISKNDPYAKYRILPRDLAEYNGKSEDNIPEHLRWVFNPKHPNARKALILSPICAFRDRTGIANPDAEEEDSKTVEWLNQLVGDIGNVVVDEGHILKNPKTKQFKVVKSLKAQYYWILTGTAMSNRVQDFCGLLALLYDETWEDALSASEKLAWNSGKLNIFSANATPAMKRLRVNPRFLEKACAKKNNLPEIMKIARAAMEMIYLRRTRGSKIPSGSTRISVGAALPPLKISTISITFPPHQAAELQLHHRYYVQLFQAALRNGAKRTEDGKFKFSYPTSIYRKLCNLSTSLLLERVSNKLEQVGLSTSAENIQKWRAAKPPIDYRWWSTMGKLEKDPVMVTKEEYLQFQADLCPKLKWLCGFVSDFVIGMKEKVILFFEWQPVGQKAEDFFKALHFRTAMIHADMNQLQRHDIIKRFNDPNDDSIEMLFLAYRISAHGLNAQGSCRRMVLLEPAISRGEEMQAIGRIHRDLQLRACYIYRLYGVNTMDKFREWKSTDKFIPEVAIYSDGDECAAQMRALMAKAFPEEEWVAGDHHSIAKGAELIVQHLFNLEGMSSEDGSNPELVYDQLKHAHPRLALA